MKGWRRIGMILSVIWFLGFGLYQWGQPTFQLQLLEKVLHDCYLLHETAIYDAQEFAKNADDMNKRWMPGIEARFKECEQKANLQFERTRPSVYVRLADIIVFNLLSIGLGWLVAWGCIALGHWVHRGFAEG